jgi:ATP-dependent exoDNAse (exonuclease V) beta subunit
MLAELNHPYRDMLKRYIHKEAVNEEMRILYVALTRAESKLILTGVLDDETTLKTLAREVQANDYDESADAVVFNHQMRNVNCYLDWIMTALMRHPQIQQDLITYVPEIAPLLKLNTKRFAKLNNAHTALARFHLTIDEFDHIMEYSVTMHKSKAEDLYPQVARYYEYQYPYEDQKRSIEVTALEALAEEKHLTTLTETESMKRREAMDLGTLVHNVLYYFTFDHDDPKALIGTLNNEGMFTQEEYQKVMAYLPHLEAFVHSSLYQSISKATQIYKEKSFRYKDQDQVINGIFDLVYFDEQGIHVVDYKTDRVSQSNSDTKLRQKHLTQLSYYKKALSTLGKEVTGVLYYLNIDTAVNV